MRPSVRLTLSLVAGVVLVSLGLALYQAQAERHGLRHELERRSLVIAESLEKSAAPLVQANSTRALQRMILQVKNHERLAGVAVYDAQGKSLVETPGLKSTQAAMADALRHALQPHSGNGEFFRVGGKTMHVVARPMTSDTGPVGMLAI